ncbi:phospholipid-transporting ATPase IA-like [Corticium candelabrum]|uniref:phospholipid-transporting ATPase IA-like n=1 Tax=Corticium candelabrum TaxID=121492 RepID=UPI002E269223|nr:phospholipid-transporting ATPase IA-like [Corticium candelabrum]
MNNPKLYKASQSAEHYNTKVFWAWIIFAVVHSLVAFWLVALAIADGVATSCGVSVGQWFVSVTVYTVIILIVNFKAGLITEVWTWISHLSIWGSIALWFIFLLIYCHLWPVFGIGIDLFAVDWQVFSSGAFWFAVMVVPVVALIPDIVMFGFRQTVWKTPAQKLFEEELLKSLSARYTKQHDETEEGIELTYLPHPDYSSVLSTRLDKDKQRGYAFSQEENGCTSQRELIRQYDTTEDKPSGN